ncbi:hypothetical protein CSUI_010812 [Cystoisospora suis]|uniref:Transmembrane protein n=1 Tax=Cystoisospora suis TaxID=483139 RepID=A0A2C6KC32_9APIC|nr:hypothetical protein CSUI_010812 [Cystoisospora suis]
MRGQWGVNSIARVWGLLTCGFPLDLVLDCFLIRVIRSMVGGRDLGSRSYGGEFTSTQSSPFFLHCSSTSQIPPSHLTPRSSEDHRRERLFQSCL